MELLKQPENQEISYLTAMVQNNVDKWNQKSRLSLDERIFFGKVMGMAKKVTLKAVKNHDTQIFEIFQQYLNEFDGENNNLENDCDSEKNFNSGGEMNEDDDLSLQNSTKKPKKGRPKRTQRIKNVTEVTSKKNWHCKVCKKVGHYSSTCMHNSNRKGKS